MNRNQAQVAAIVALLDALSPAMLDAVLEGVGVEQEKRDGHPRTDSRRCRVCGFGWVRHKVLSDHPEDGHEWDPVG